MKVVMKPWRRPKSWTVRRRRTPALPRRVRATTSIRRECRPSLACPWGWDWWPRTSIVCRPMLARSWAWLRRFGGLCSGEGEELLLPRPHPSTILHPRSHLLSRGLGPACPLMVSFQSCSISEIFSTTITVNFTYLASFGHDSPKWEIGQFLVLCNCHFSHLQNCAYFHHLIHLYF